MQKLEVVASTGLHAVLVLHCAIFVGAPRARLKLFSADEIHEVTTRNCRSGAFMLEPFEYQCACITGVWALYSKFCKRPVMIIGGDNYCFKFDPLVKISQAIPIGNVKYPFSQALSHFREDFIIMTKTFVTDYSVVDIDATSTFIAITDKPWTIREGKSKSLCLNGSSPGNDGRVFCMFDLTKGVNDDWMSITGIQRGCHSDTIVEADECQEIFPPNDENLCYNLVGPPENVSTITELPDTTMTPIWSTTEEPESTTEPPNLPCEPGFTKNDVQSYWESPLATTCPRSIAELVLTDQLRRFSVLQMNKRIRTRLLSLQQTEELLLLQADLIKITCPHYAVPPEFIDVAIQAFGMFIRDDFFYGVEETEAALFERIVYAIRSCIQRAKPFEFTTSADECNSTLRIEELIVDGMAVPIVLNEASRWIGHEPLIESGWKMFLNAHSYCYEDFLQQNDHHTFAVRMMQLFSLSIYEKWTQPLPTLGLYKFIVPNANTLEVTMDNLDRCVAALAYNTKCPVLLSKTAARDVNEESQNEEISSNNLSRKKRSIWITHIQRNREQTKIWNGIAHCLQNPDDPSYYLGYGRCAHP